MRIILGEISILLFPLILAACYAPQTLGDQGSIPFRLAYLREDEQTYMYFNNQVFASYRPGWPQPEVELVVNSLTLHDSVFTLKGKLIDAESKKGVDSIELYVGTYGIQMGSTSDLDGGNPQPTRMFRINETPYHSLSSNGGRFELVARISTGSRLFIGKLNYAFQIYYVGRLLARQVTNGG